MNRNRPELLCPAGDWERLKLAVAYGADAVYLAGTTFGMRSFAGNFTPEELPKAVAYAHEHGVKAHVTVNTMPRNHEVVELPAWLELLDDAKSRILNCRVEDILEYIPSEDDQIL